MALTSRQRNWHGLLTAVFTLTLLRPVVIAAARPDPWLDGVTEFVMGEFGGFGSQAMPGVVFGPPDGGGLLQGGTDVVSLGHGGQITGVFRDNVVFDGPGDDLVVFENAFHSGSTDGPIFTDLGVVEVSQDGLTWLRFPFDPVTGEGLAGRTPVLAARDNEIDPLSPQAGGDRFDIGMVGLGFVRFVRVLDGGDAIADIGNLTPPADKAGFDLDSIAGLHWSPSAIARGSVTAGGAPVGRALVKLVPADGTRRLRKRTRADGTFRFRPVVPSGDYRVIARKAGRGRAERVIHLGLDVLRVDVDLELR